MLLCGLLVWLDKSSATSATATETDDVATTAQDSGWLHDDG